jgi:hypothetical protein
VFLIVHAKGIFCSENPLQIGISQIVALLVAGWTSAIRHGMIWCQLEQFLIKVVKTPQT